jgi:S-adenosylmethionine:tRNA ribosyltransferase-isomerase
MIAADRPVPRPATAKLLLVDADGRISTTQRSRWTSFLECGDVVIANDAATLPASLKGSHVRTGRAIEVRLAAWCRGAPASTIEFDAVVFGDGDHRTPTEQRSLPPLLAPNDVLMLGPLCATIVRTLDHPRLVRLRFNATGRGFWLALAEHGRPIQYAYMREALGLRDVWTSIANVPVAFEAPSAGFILDWQTIESLAQRRVRFATLTHAAGISSTGDADLDRRLPFAEWYDIPATTAAIVNRAIRSGGRVIAIGTTVVRALEDAARNAEPLRSGQGTAQLRIDATTRLRVIDAIVTGTHERGSSHHRLLRAFADDDALTRADDVLANDHYRTHEFGDSMLVFRSRGRAGSRRALRAAA